jgi:hypothetical protein
MRNAAIALRDREIRSVTIFTSPRSMHKDKDSKNPAKNVRTSPADGGALVGVNLLQTPDSDGIAAA